MEQGKRKLDGSLDAGRRPQEPSAKRLKGEHLSNYAPRFWDTLTTVRVTRRALREFDRRLEPQTSILATQSASATQAAPRRKRVLRSDLSNLREFASGGGPDLSAIRGYSDSSSIKPSMSQSGTGSRKRASNTSITKSSKTGKTKSTTPYSGEFEQKLIDRGVYPPGHRLASGERAPKPNNVDEIRLMLSEPRRSLSPSAFSENAFEDFQESNFRAASESKAMTDVVPVIAGSKDREYDSERDISFSRLKKFDPDLSIPQPDLYYGARPTQIDQRVRHDLDEYIIPANQTQLPAAPNFFLEGKGASGRLDIAKRQAMYDGAIGARGILHLQNYGKEALVYDGKAYTLVSTYQPGAGFLQLYALHPRQPSNAEGDPEYYMSKIKAYDMTSDIEMFREGATAYRNAREWARQQRDQFIEDANAVARKLPVNTDATNHRAGSQRATESETSGDELAVDYDASAKRRRRSTRSH